MIKIKKELVSVIIAFYKVENQIERCIKSVLEQTYENIEIICVGSKKEDASKTIVKKIIKENSTIKYLEQSGIGVGNARNEGLTKSKGDYILFLDGDDYIKKNCVSLLVKDLHKNKSDIACCGFRRIDDITKKIYSHEMTSMKYDNLILNDQTIMEIPYISPAPWGKLYKRDLIINEKFCDKPVAAEDLLFFLKIIQKTKKISFIKKELWNYVVRGDSLIFETTEEKAYVLCDNLIKIRKEYENNNLNKNYLKMIDLVAFIHLGISMSTRINNNVKKYIKTTKQNLNNNFIFWKKVKIRNNGHITLKTMIITFVRFMYKINIFILFVHLYNFMIKSLKIDIKW